MNIIVCIKLGPDVEDMETLSDGNISLEKAEWTIGEYDLVALEAAAQLGDAAGGKVTALSVGPVKINHMKLRKEILSRGAHELVLVMDDRLAVNDTHLTASVLAEAIRKLGPADLVICGEGSADLYFQQVGLQTGELLGWPTLNAISKVETLGEGTVRVERSLEDEVEVLEVPLPAVLSVTTDIKQPRLPSMKDILSAGKKPVTEWKLEDLGGEGMQPGIQVLEVRAPRQVARKNIRIPGTPDEAAEALVNYLSQERVL